MWQRLAGLERCKNSVLDNIGEVYLAQVAQHHRRREDQRGWVDHVLAGVLRRRAVHRLEDCHAVSVVGTRREAKSTNKTRGKVANDVAVQVGGNHHIKLRRVFHHLVRDVVNDQMIRL